ncbi:MAG: hypothetical protein ACYDA1_07205 [Vulcanimicrobiaceae bacterium]
MTHSGASTDPSSLYAELLADGGAIKPTEFFAARLEGGIWAFTAKSRMEAVVALLDHAIPDRDVVIETGIVRYPSHAEAIGTGADIASAVRSTLAAWAQERAVNADYCISLTDIQAEVLAAEMRTAVERALRTGRVPLAQVVVEEREVQWMPYGLIAPSTPDLVRRAALSKFYGITSKDRLCHDVERAYGVQDRDGVTRVFAEAWTIANGDPVATVDLFGRLLLLVQDGSMQAHEGPEIND